MSTSLYWKPVEKVEGHLPDALKFKLRELFQLPQTFHNAHIETFRALRACGIEGASEVLSLIKEHGEIEIGEE